MLHPAWCPLGTSSTHPMVGHACLFGYMGRF
uniref:Uncharacterized protein n=1 Tax=Arundo donax TaxID=35708 RepID=A0A0A8YJN8_ARUDO